MQINTTVKKATIECPVDYIPDSQNRLTASLHIMLNSHGYYEWFKNKESYKYEDISISDINKLIQVYPDILKYCKDVPETVITYHKMWWS